MTHHTTNEIPYGYCHCGCGQRTRLAPHTNKNRGWVKGEPIRFVQNHRLKSSPEQIFEKYLQRSAPDECWEWAGLKSDTGYGHFRVGKKDYAAHRFSYEHFIGPIPKGKLVCHSCDNRGCVNPNHLWLGSYSDNTSDAISKGRLVRDEHSKKFTRDL